MMFLWDPVFFDRLPPIGFGIADLPLIRSRNTRSTRPIPILQGVFNVSQHQGLYISVSTQED